MNSVMQTMLEHSSVRSFENKAVDTSLLEQVLECGQAASTSSFIQAYSIVRVQDSDNREKIAQAAGGQQWVIEAPEFLVFCADMKRIQYALDKLDQGELPGLTEHFMASTVDVALMAQNVLLAAESAGLGGVFIGGIRNNPQLVCDCLELPQLVYPVFGMCLGWPAQRVAVKKRMPLSTVLHQERYNAEAIPQQIDAFDAQMEAYYAQRSDNVKSSNWSQQTVQSLMGKKREHMLEFLQGRGFLKL
jgi:nitroreductase